MLIGICGRTASGKTSFAKSLCDRLHSDGISAGLLQMDNFYRALSSEEHKQAVNGEYDFDCLSSFDMTWFKECLCKARDSQPVVITTYNHAEHTLSPSTITITNQPKVWIVEGLYLYADPDIASLFDIKLFMDVEADVSLIRRLRRDCVERNRTIPEILTQYERYVRPGYMALVEPYRHRADITIHRGIDNIAAFEMVIRYITLTCVSPVFNE